MANQFDRRRINVKGGGLLQIRQIDPTPAAAFTTIGFIAESTFFDEHTMVDSIDDSGRFIDTKSGAQKVHFTSTLKQTSKDEIDLFKNAEAQYTELYYRATLNNGQIQEFVIPCARIKPGVELAFKSATERTIAIEITALAPATALTRTPTNFNTSQWQYYVLYESGTAVGPPSDNGSVPQAAL